MGLKRNILNNSIASIIQKAVRVLEQLLLVPFFISTWGVAYYGEWLTLTIIPSILAFSDFGIGTAAANSFVLKYASGEKKLAADIEKTGFIIISFMILLGIVLCLTVMMLCTHFDWFAKSLIHTDDAIKAVSFLMVVRFTVFYNQLFDAHFRATRRVALGINLNTMGSIISIVASIMVLLFKGNIVQYALWQLIGSVSFNLFFWYIAISILDLRREYKGVYNKSFAKEIFTTGIGFVMIPAWQMLLFQGTTFIVRIILGPVSVAIFNTVRTLSRSVNQMYSIINVSIQPEMQYEIGANNMEKAQKIFIYAIRFSFILALIGVLFLVLFGLPFYNWWTQKALIPPVVMWYVFLTGILLNTVWWTAAVVYGAINKPYKMAVPGMIAAGATIIVFWFCCKIWGLNGAAVGCLVFEIMMLAYTLPVSCKLMGIKLKTIFDLKIK
jgi:O-antigen/teichoic acid export membrane protein